MFRGVAAMPVVTYHYFFRFDQLYGHVNIPVEWTRLGLYGVHFFSDQWFRYLLELAAHCWFVEFSAVSVLPHISRLLGRLVVDIQHCLVCRAVSSVYSNYW